MSTPEFHFVSNASSALSELGKSRDYILYLPNFAIGTIAAAIAIEYSCAPLLLS
jgi:hypothetical protein